MVLLGIMASQFMSLLDEGVADTGERLVKSKLLKWLRSGTASWRGGKDELLVKCVGFDYCVVTAGGSSATRCGLSLDQVMKSFLVAITAC
jgi:hypothetical protein